MSDPYQTSIRNFGPARPPAASDRPNVPTLLAEVAEILRQHGDLHCVPGVEVRTDASRLRIIIDVTPETDEDALVGARTLDLCHDLQRLVGLAQVRAFVQTYRLDPAALEPFLPKP